MLQNPKEEKYCLIWHESGNKTKAYRESHPNSANWKDVTIHNKASALSKRGDIMARFSELQNEALASHGITIKSLLDELDEARVIAITAETPQSSAAISATMNKAKLVGLDKNVLEVNANVTTRATLDDFYN